MHVARPSLARFDQVLDLLQASDAAVWGASDWTAEDLRSEWSGLDLERDAWLVEIDGRLAGVAHLLGRKGERFIGDAYVHPELTGRGAGTLLLALLEDRARETQREWPPGEDVVLEVAHLVGDAAAPDLFRTEGFERVRSFFRMAADLAVARPRPAWPPEVELRPLEIEHHGAELHAAETEAFAREWGYVPLAYGAWLERAFPEERSFDPALIPAAWAGDEIVAFARNYPKRNGDWGWIGTLGVRPAWRRRGLGLALLHESFERFRAVGETTVALGVDVENPTGATRLYERAGMRVLWQGDVWHKPLRDTTARRPARPAAIAG